MPGSLENVGLDSKSMLDSTTREDLSPANRAILKTMRRDEGFKVVIGESWRSSLSTEVSVPGSPVRVDFGRVRDVIDIVVDGTSICGRTDEDSIFFLVRDLLGSLVRLASGETGAKVSFYESPFELIFLRFGSWVYITFYRLGKRPQVAVKDQKVPFEALRSGIIASTELLLDQAVGLDSKAKSDPLVQGIKELLKKVKAGDKKSLCQKAASMPPSKVVRSTRWKSPRSENSFSFGFEFEASGTDLLAPAKLKGSDLSALLFSGRHVVHARGRRFKLGRGFLFLQTERLLSSLRQLLSAWEEGRPMSVRLISEGLIVGVRLGDDDGLVASFMDSSKNGAIVVLNDLSPWEYADAILGVARELRRLTVEVSPDQRRNLRMEAFSREVRALTDWVKEQKRGTVINEDIEVYRDLAKQRRNGDSPVLIGEAGRLRFREQWRIEVEGPDLQGTALFGNMVIISAKNGILGIDLPSGAMAWRRESDRTGSRIQIAGPDGLVKASPSGSVEFIDLFTGVLRWRTGLAPRSGGAPVILAVDHGCAPGLVVAAEEDKKLVALDIRSGEPRWRFTAARGGNFALLRYGRLLYISSNDNHFNAVDIEDGSLVWRFAKRTRFCTPPGISGDTILVIGGRPGHPDGKIYALNAFSGEMLFETPLKGGAVTAPIVADGAALVPIRIGHRHEFVGVDTSKGEILWRRDCSGWADPSALMALDKCFIINSAGGVIRSIGARDGKERWGTTLGPTCSEDVPLSLKVVLRGGMLFVPADTVYVVSPKDGTIIHSLGGEPPVPDLLQVDPSCSIFVAEDSGHMAMFTLSSRLSVVS